MQGYKTWKIKNDISEELWNRLKAACIISKKRISDWLTEAVQEKLDREKK